MEPQVAVTFIDMTMGTLEERQKLRLAVAANLATILEYVIVRGLIKKTDPPPPAVEWERVQRSHIVRYMRSPQNPLLSEAERQAGGRIDRASLALCDAIRAWDQLCRARRTSEFRKMQATQREAKRQAKLLQRRVREAEKMVAAQPRPKLKKQVVHEEVERCAKCHKRPAIKSGLCDPCFQWEHAKLGRE